MFETKPLVIIRIIEMRVGEKKGCWQLPGQGSPSGKWKRPRDLA